MTMKARCFFRLGAAAAGAALALAAALQPVLAAGIAVVTTRVVYPGETLSVDALREVTLRQGFRATIPFVDSTDEIEGKIARRTLLPGRLIPPDSVREPYLVKAGQPVQVIYAQGALTISATAVPLEPGSAGDVVKVRNLDSGAVFSGVVMADGTIRVGAT
jgi:flagella basal body P-ring formation protein FlgA